MKISGKLAHGYVEKSKMTLSKKQKQWAVFVVLILCRASYVLLRDFIRSYPMKVTLNFTYQGRDYTMSHITRCKVIDKVRGLEAYTVTVPDQSNRGFGMRMPDGTAVVAMIPSRCAKPPRKLQQEFFQLKGNEYPVMGYLPDADDPSRILLYSAPRAYEEDKGPFKYNWIVISAPEFGEWVSPPSEFSWFAPFSSKHEGPTSLYWLSGFLYAPEPDDTWSEHSIRFQKQLYPDIQNPEVTQLIPLDGYNRIELEWLFNARKAGEFHGGLIVKNKSTTWNRRYFDGFPIFEKNGEAHVDFSMQGFLWLTEPHVYTPSLENTIPKLNATIHFPEETVDYNNQLLWLASEQKLFYYFVYAFDIQLPPQYSSKEK